MGEIPYYEPESVDCDEDDLKLSPISHTDQYEGDLTFGMMLPKMTKSARN